MNTAPVYFGFAVVYTMIAIAVQILPSTPMGLY